MKARVRASGVLVRQSNSNMSPVIGSVAPGTVLDIEAEYGEWVKLTSGGWVKTCYTEAMEVSGGASSWNDLEDKPFYEESGIVEVLAECQPTFAEGFFVLDDIAIVVGETYTVNWNNVAYECVAQDAGAPALGNMSVFEGPDSGEPFAIAQEGAWIAVALDGATELTLSIYQNGTVVHTLDPKYLPFKTETVDKYEEVVLIDNGLKPSTSSQDLLSDVSANLQEGDVVRIVINHDGSKLETTGALGKLESSASGELRQVALENSVVSDTLSVNYIYYYPSSSGGTFRFRFTASSQTAANIMVTHTKLADSYPVIKDKNLPWLKITYDGTSYAANMTYAEAVALIESKSLLGGCLVGEEGAVNSLSSIYHSKEESAVRCRDSYDEYYIYADGTVAMKTGK